MRIGTYRITAGTRRVRDTAAHGVEVLVGQQVALNLVLMPSAVAESVTVTGEAPLVNVGVVESGRQHRFAAAVRAAGQWPQLAGPDDAGAGRAGEHTEAGGMPAASHGAVQLNIDGMQVTNNCCAGANRQPSFSRDAIAEFQLVANRFDATQGRSSGAQVNAITKSGTNSCPDPLAATSAATR